MQTIIKLPGVIKIVGLSRSTIYSFISKGKFPKPIPLGGRSVGWLDSDIEKWIDKKVEEAREHNDNEK